MIENITDSLMNEWKIIQSLIAEKNLLPELNGANLREYVDFMKVEITMFFFTDQNNTNEILIIRISGGFAG